MDRSARIVEVGPRDGLQNEPAQVPTAVKVHFVEALAATGVAEIEVSAFVSPRRVPQLGDASDVFGAIDRRSGVTYSALVPNGQGLDRALAAGVDKIAVFTAVSETFNQKNIHTSLDGALERFRPLIARARATGLPVRGYLSTAWWCAYEGRIPPRAAIDLAQRLVDLGADEVAVSDTVGRATPDEVARLLDGLLPRVPAEQIAVHFHDTYGCGVANVRRAWEYGIRIFDASVGGLGGCPFSPGATGNVATADVVAALAALGAAPGVALDGLERARRLLDPYLRDDPGARPAAEPPPCAVCEHRPEAACCGREPIAGQLLS
jgi:hydroxymethylglutaryl-CoA lyase